MARNYELQNLFEEKLKMLGTTLNEFCRVNGITKNTYYSAFENEKRVRKQTLLKLSVLLRLNNSEIFNLLLFHGYVLSISPLDRALVEYLSTTPVEERNVERINQIFEATYPVEQSAELKKLLNRIRENAIYNALRDRPFTVEEVCFVADIKKKAFYSAISNSNSSFDTILKIGFAYCLTNQLIDEWLLCKGFTWRSCDEDLKIRHYLNVTPIVDRSYDDMVEYLAS